MGVSQRVSDIPYSLADGLIFINNLLISIILHLKYYSSLLAPTVQATTGNQASLQCIFKKVRFSSQW